MKTLIVNKNGTLEIKEVAKPAYNSKEALVKTIACGMCGTDIKLIQRSFKGVPESSYPLMLGHEGVGEVVEIGAEVKGLKVGDKVLLTFNIPTDDFGSAWGALSEYAVVQDSAAYPPGAAPEVAYAQVVLENDLNPVDAVMFVTFREVLSAIRYFGIKPQDTVAVFGCGAVGFAFIKLLNLLGCKDIIAVDRIDEKLKEAAKYGAKKTINNSGGDITEAVRAEYPNGIKYVVDAVGLSVIANQAMTLLQDRGSVLCYGTLEKGEVTINFKKAPYNWNFICQQMPDKLEESEAHSQILEWVRSGKLVMKDFISDYFSFDDSVTAFEKFLDHKLIKKGVIKF